MIEYTLKPGLLVNMTTSVNGNVSYRVNDYDVKRDGDAETTDIHTTKLVIDVNEQQRAIKERTKIRGLILSACVRTASGSLLCPTDREPQLREAILLGRELTDKFNANAKTTHIRFSVMCGRIAQDDVETIRDIANEIRDLLDDAKQGVKTFNVKMIRDACNTMTQVGKVLTPEAYKRIQAPIVAARAAATQIAKAGEQAAIEIDRATLRKISAARTSFLDTNTEVAEIEAPKFKGRALDL